MRLRHLSDVAPRRPSCQSAIPPSLSLSLPPSLRPSACGRSSSGLTHAWPFLAQVIVGTKAGTLCLYDISSSTLLAETQAHEGAVWSIQVRPDQRGLVSGSADKDVKFWDFEMKETDQGAQVVQDRMGVERVVRPACIIVRYDRSR